MLSFYIQNKDNIHHRTKTNIKVYRIIYFYFLFSTIYLYEGTNHNIIFLYY